MRKRWRQLSPRWKRFILIAIVLLVLLFVAIRILYWTIVSTTMESMYEEYEPSLMEASEGKLSEVEHSIKGASTK